MGIPVITEGATTTHGGEIIECVHTFRIHGKGIHADGMSHHCLKCGRTVSAIASNHTKSILGKAIVLEGDKTTCGASFIASQNTAFISFRIIISFNVLLLIFSIVGCVMDNPAHRPFVEGDIKISKNSEGNLCFMPILSTATIMENPINLTHIKIGKLVILEPKQANDRIKIKIEPVGKKYFTLDNEQKICLNSNNSELEQTIYTPLDTQSLAVLISGLDDKGEHSISFYKEFNYPYIPE